MKNLKIIKNLISITVILILITGCGNKNIEGTLENIMTQVYAELTEEERPMMLTNIPVNEENIEYYLGTSDIEYDQALASESGIGSIAHSVVLVRTKNNADIENIKEKILENVDPRKWICVGVEKEDLIVKNKGNLIILIMIEDETTRNKIEKSFDNLK